MGERIVPGPLTLRMMERVVSSMNSTRTWVTPPREPMSQEIRQQFVLQVVPNPPWPCSSSPKRLVLCAQSSSFHSNLSRRFLSAGDGEWIVVVLSGERTGTAEDAGDLDELDGDLCGFHFEVLCDELRWADGKRRRRGSGIFTHGERATDWGGHSEIRLPWHVCVC
jgi:hypothetical protein